MNRRTVLILAMAITAILAAKSAEAQEFRIYTKIYDMSPKKPVIAARTLALFHAGKVYDHIDSVGEVIIFEPMQKRFTILNTKRALATTIHFDEIKRYLKSARGVAEENLQELKQRNSPSTGMLEFQLDPRFKTTYVKAANQLTLNSPFMRYDVVLTSVETKEIAAAYRKYADWMNRLNFVLHPRRLMPDPRMALNEQLGSRHAIPVEVVLRVNQRTPMHLKAEHQIQWKLGTNDRNRLTGWKSLLADPFTRKVTFREYQKAVRVQ